MGAQAKIINMLLYDGTLNGVLRIEDSSWNAGELFSAPRDSMSELLKTGACNKYGVYLLLSPNMVYVGQSSDLAKRMTQHLNGKDWWDSAVIITTKDDSLNHSDIDYLENVLIEKALAMKKLDCDNKKSGNPPKVDVFRKVFLGQYLDEALFLMQLIGIKVFAEEKPTRKKRSKPVAVKPVIEVVAEPTQPLSTFTLPDLPSMDMKIGVFVNTAMRNLEKFGYSFTLDAIDEMCTPEWSMQTFHTKKPFMKKYVAGVTDNKGSDGYVRFRSDPFTFGGQQVLLSKEWFESQRTYFVDWYCSLGHASKEEAARGHVTLGVTKKTSGIPALPDRSLKAGTFVKTAMENLSQSGFEFTDEEIRVLCSDSSMHDVIGMQRNLPFFKLYDPADSKGHLINGRPRFYSKPLTYGNYTVYLNSQIYETDKEPFVAWYNELKR